MTTAWYQALIKWLGGGLAALLLFGAVLDTLSNAATWITPAVTYVGSFAVVVTVCALQVCFKVWGLRWRQGDQLTTIRSFSWKPISSAVGILTLLWIPRLLTPFPAQAIEATPDSVTYALPPGLILGRVIRTIVEDDNSSPRFSRLCRPILTIKVREGQVRAVNRIELIRQLQYRLLSAPTPPTKLDVAKLADKGIYEINCSR